MASSSISSSLRLFTTKISNPIHSSKTLLLQKPRNFVFFKSISFQRIPTRSSSPLPLQSPPSSTSPASASASASTSMSLQPLEELPPKLQEIIKLFQSVQESKAKYQQLLFYGKNLKPLDIQFKTKQNKVEGCVSQVWVRAYLDSDMNVVFEADSDSDLTKGLAALLVLGLSGRRPEEIVRVSPDFAVLLGLQQSLTPSRNNGFLNMLKLMQRKALELLVESENGLKGSNSAALKSDDPVQNETPESHSSADVEIATNDSNFSSNIVSTPVDSISGDLGSRGRRIKEKLEKELNPIELQIEDVSYQHAGHAGVRGSDGETHFNLKVVSEEFESMSLVKRHRLIYNLLQEELQTGLHALSIVAKTPSEANER